MAVSLPASRAECNSHDALLAQRIAFPMLFLNNSTFLQYFISILNYLSYLCSRVHYERQQRDNPRPLYHRLAVKRIYINNH